ncbi:MAG: hypothetical protein ACLQAT_04955 [Candidatus Binataceae bacterium]
MAATGSAYSSVFLATIAPLHEVARPLTPSDKIVKIDRTGGRSKYFLQNKPNLSFISLDFFGFA